MKRRAFTRLSLLGAAAFGWTQRSKARPTSSSKIGPVIRPRALRRGDLIGLFAPGSAVSDGAIEKAVRQLEGWGFRVKEGSYIRERLGFLAGSDIHRLEDLHRLWADPEVRGMWALRGGYGCTRLLPMLDYKMITANPKVLIGYSDVTALLIALQQRCGLITFHGPVAVSDMTAFTEQHVLKMLMDGGLQTLQLSAEEQKTGDATNAYRVYRQGVATGILSGGNLTLLAALAGTPWQWDARGKLAFLEDIDERPYRLDRMLVQLQQSSGLDETAGLAFGIFSGCHPKPGESSLSLHETLEGHTNINAAVYGCSIGHVSNQWTIPLGVRATFDTDQGVLRLLESPLVHV